MERTTCRIEWLLLGTAHGRVLPARSGRLSNG